MPALTPPDQTEIDTWQIEEAGVEDGSSPKVTFDAAGSVATRQFWCLWEYRYKVARWFVGEADWYLDGSDRVLTRLVPQKLPRPADLPEWVPDFYATKVPEITGHCWDGIEPNDWRRITEAGSITDEPQFPDDDEYQFTEDTVNKYTHALVTVQYERQPFTIENDDGTTDESERWTEYVTKPSPPEYITVPSSTQNYIDPAGVSYNNPPGHLVPVPYPVGLVESSYRFMLKWHRIPYDCWGPNTPLFDKIMGDGTPGATYLNAVNDTEFMGLAVGTVMLEEVGEELVPVLLDRGLMNWNLMFHMWYKPGGHNQQWFFPNANEWAAAGDLAKRMLVARGSTYYAPGSVPDLKANYVEKNLYALFNIDG